MKGVPEQSISGAPFPLVVEPNDAAAAWSTAYGRGLVRGTAGEVSATWTLNLGNGTAMADESDFATGLVRTGTVTFAAGATTAEIRLPVLGDTVFEANETFSVTLTDPQGGATLTRAVATGTITNDDAAPPVPPAYSP